FPDGVHAFATYGHSPGHTSYVIKSKGGTLIILGDVMLSPMQFPFPSLGSGFDADRSAAATTRIRILNEAARDHDWAAGGHIPFPGIGKLRRLDRGFQFLPPQFEAGIGEEQH